MLIDTHAHLTSLEHVGQERTWIPDQVRDDKSQIVNNADCHPRSFCHPREGGDPVWNGKTNSTRVVVERAKEAGVGKIICVGVNLEDSKKTIEIASRFDNVFATVGIHPEEQANPTVEEIITLAKSKHVVAIGECGIDLGKQRTWIPHQVRDDNVESQRELFRKQIGVSIELDLPLIIHNRNADEIVLEELKRYKETGKLKGVVHCFTSPNLEFAQEVLELGFYISVTGIITYKSAQNFLHVIKAVPLNKLMVETDSPYLTPEPKNVKLVAEKLAEIKSITFEEVEKTTTANAQKLFRI